MITHIGSAFSFCLWVSCSFSMLLLLVLLRLLLLVLFSRHVVGVWRLYALNAGEHVLEIACAPKCFYYFLSGATQRVHRRYPRSCLTVFRQDQRDQSQRCHKSGIAIGS